MPEAWLDVGALTVRLAQDAAGAVEVPGAARLVLVTTGWPSGASLERRVGEHVHQLVADDEGGLRRALPDVLVAVAGLVSVGLSAGDVELGARLVVRPTRLATEALVSLLDALEDLAPGLAGDLGGRAGVERAHTSPAEAMLRLLERLEGPIVSACARVRAQPIASRSVHRRAFVSDRAPVSSADLRWALTHPARVARVRAGGRQVGVLAEEHVELDVAENRGLLALFQQLERLGDAVGEVLTAEEARLLGARARREAFLTQRSNLFAERDLPRLKALRRRRDRLVALQRNLVHAERSLGLPATMRAAPFARSARAERHPGYWALFRAWVEVRGLLPLRAMPSFLPLRNTDELYELWTTLAFVEALGRLLGRTLLDQLPVEQGWFAELPRGELVSVEVSGLELVVHREPAYGHGGDAAIQKLVPGRPWRPDIVLEVRAAGQPVALHVFDAKHALRSAGPDRAPLELFDKPWLKYVDSIGTRAGVPLVESCWMLYPGRFDRPLWKTPSMKGAGWPGDRPLGGSVAFAPGRLDALERVLGHVLQRAGA